MIIFTNLLKIKSQNKNSFSKTSCSYFTPLEIYPQLHFPLLSSIHPSILLETTHFSHPRPRTGRNFNESTLLLFTLHHPPPRSNSRSKPPRRRFLVATWKRGGVVAWKSLRLLLGSNPIERYRGLPSFKDFFLSMCN